MRIAIVHSFYRSVLPSGENQVVEQQVRGLRSRGHEVVLVSRSSDDLRSGMGQRAHTAWQVARHEGADPTPELSAMRPDVVHVHNLFPNISSEWLTRWEGPVVATLHNFRSVCASAVLSRHGHVCTLCPDGNNWASLRHRCYRGSMVATLPMTWRTRGGVAGDPVMRRADALVVLSESSMAMFERFGVDPGLMSLIPNGVPDPGVARPIHGGPFAAVGRLSPEKGFPKLLREWPPDVALEVVGDGPLLPELRKIAPDSVRFHGLMPHDDFLVELSGFRGVVIPGSNPEGGYPMVMVEALAADVPLVARRGGVVAPLIMRHGGGSLFTDADDLPVALAAAAALPPGGPRRVYEELFTEAGWLTKLEMLYDKVATGAGGRSSERP